MTANGKIILDIINQSNNHLTAEEIYNEVKLLGKRMSIATVYNNLNSLYEAGEIRKLSLEDKTEHYDKLLRHDHLVCKGCGKITDLMFDDMTKLFEKNAGVKLETYDLKLIYICKECKKLKK